MAGEQQALGIGQAPLEIQAREGLSVAPAEQNADWAMQVAKRAVTLDRGTCVVDGACADSRRDRCVQAAYLGL